MARVPFYSTLIAVLAAAAVVVPAGSARQSVLPTLYVQYTMNCTFAISDDSGKRVSSIAPGTYQVYVETPLVFAIVDLSGIYDMTACKSFVQFKLTGPGVSLDTTLQQGDEDKELLNATFLPSSTYTATDLNQPSVARATVSTTASGAVNSPTGPTSSTSSKGQTQGELAGSAAFPFRGALDVTVYKTGKLAVHKAGKNVSQLKQGKYTFSVDDESKTAGFTLKSLRGKPVAITSNAFVGSHNVTVTLAQGRWYYYSPGGKQFQFIVFAA
jgi:hypothetical protein